MAITHREELTTRWRAHRRPPSRVDLVETGLAPVPHPLPIVAVCSHPDQSGQPLRPGMAGLWQVSGRGDLSWEDSAHRTCGTSTTGMGACTRRSSSAPLAPSCTAAGRTE